MNLQGLGAGLTSTGLQQGHAIGAGGFQLGQGLQQQGQKTSLQQGGLQLGANQQATVSRSSLIGQSIQLPQPTQSVQTGGLQLGGKPPSQSGGLQLGQTQLGGGGLGQTAAASQGLQLGGGNAMAAPGGLQLGQGQLGVGVGQTAMAAPGGLQLGSGLKQTATVAPGGLQLGQLGLKQTAAPQLGQLGSGLRQTTTAAPGGLQLGQNQLGTGLKLGQTATPSASSSTGLQLGQSQVKGGLSLGVAGQTTGGLQLGPSSTSSLTGLKLGGLSTSISTTQAGLGGSGLKLGGLSTATSTTQAGLGGSGLKLGGLPTATNTTQAGLVGGGLKGLGGGIAVSQGQGLVLQGVKGTGLASSTAQTSTSSGFRGLGGMDPDTSAGANGGVSGSQSWNNSPIADDLSKLVTDFKTYLKKQKETSNQFSRFSDTNFKEVNHKTSTQTQALSVVSSQIQKDSVTSSHLKEEITLELQNAEIAQRTMELPAGLQHENTAPDLYFQILVNAFEAKMELYRRQIEELESHLLAISPEAGMSSQTIVEILQLQYKPFLLLAAQLQTTHEQVQNLKEQYLSYRKVFLHNSTDIFEERRAKSRVGPSASASILTGPPPFSVTALNQPAAMLANSTGSYAGGVGLAGANLQGNVLGTGVGLSSGMKLGTGTGLGLYKPGTGTVAASRSGLLLGGGGGGVGGGSLGQSASLGYSLSQPSLGFSSGPATTAPSTALPSTQPFSLQLPPLGKRKFN